MKLLEGVHADAVVSDDGQYRYRLARIRRTEVQAVTFIMLNPSTADAHTDDMTLRKCQGYAERWGYGGNVIVVNLFALRATDPAQLAYHLDPVGPENDEWLHRELSYGSRLYVAAWGHKGGHMGRDKIVERMASDHGRILHRIGPPTPLRLMPRHPGRLAYELELERHG